MWKQISAKEINENLIKDIADEWMLITAGDRNGYNMMTASWGFLGETWGNDAAVVLVRPQRYTMDFLKKSDFFTLSFYGDNKRIHKICGSQSGRDVDKTAMTGLIPVFDEKGVYFEQARMVIFCKKQYLQPMQKECFTDTEPLSCYQEDDFHYMVFGRIEKVLVKG